MAGDNRSIDISEITPSGDYHWKYSTNAHYHHDIIKLPNGNYITLGLEQVNRKEALELGANPECFDKWGKSFVYLTFIHEIERTGQSSGKVVWQWHAKDHLIQDYDSTKSNYVSDISAHPEGIDINYNLCYLSHPLVTTMIHANGLSYNAGLEQIMITSRHFSEIWIIDHSATTAEAKGNTGGNSGKGGGLLYRWGNPRAYKKGGLSDQKLFAPHNGHWIPAGLPGAGNVLIFNNGHEWVGGQAKRGYSTVEEIALPSSGYTYTRAADSAYGPSGTVWNYGYKSSDRFYSSYVSGAHRLPNGNTLITDGANTRIFEVTSAGETVWEYLLDGILIYRALKYAKDHPGIKALGLSP